MHHHNASAGARCAALRRPAAVRGVAGVYGGPVAQPPSAGFAEATAHSRGRLCHIFLLDPRSEAEWKPMFGVWQVLRASLTGCRETDYGRVGRLAACRQVVMVAPTFPIAVSPPMPGPNRQDRPFDPGKRLGLRNLSGYDVFVLTTQSWSVNLFFTRRVRPEGGSSVTDDVAASAPLTEYIG